MFSVCFCFSSNIFCRMRFTFPPLMLHTPFISSYLIVLIFAVTYKSCYCPFILYDWFLVFYKQWGIVLVLLVVSVLCLQYFLKHGLGHLGVAAGSIWVNVLKFFMCKVSVCGSRTGICITLLCYILGRLQFILAWCGAEVPFVVKMQLLNCQ
jgi:hypothetical protein